MSTLDEALAAFMAWYAALPRVTQNQGPAKGTIAGALLVLDRLNTAYDLDINAHVAKSGTQIMGASGRTVRETLSRYGETRYYVSEGGRTNRGLRAQIEGMLEALRPLALEALPDEQRQPILSAMQQYLVAQVAEWFNRQRLEFEFDPAKSTWQMLHDLLEAARSAGKEGPVTQYLVGAKLALRFPDEPVANLSYSTADAQTDRKGDFAVQDAAFHVTVAPQPPLFEKCLRNLRDGLRPQVIVPTRVLEWARGQAEELAPGRITVVSVESFVAQNVEELACYSRTKLVSGIRALLEAYNARTDEVEIDKSMLIDIPASLLR